MKIKLFLLTTIAAAYAVAQTGADLGAFFDERWSHKDTKNLDTCSATSGESLTLKVDVSMHVPFILGILTRQQESRKITMITMDGIQFMVEEIIKDSKVTKRGSFDALTGKLSIEGNADLVLSCDKLGKK